MRIVYDFKEIVQISPPCALTIGVFDGVHLGHQEILKKMAEKALPGGNRVAVTFRSHPNQKKKNSIMDFDSRLRLLQDNSIDLVVALDFTPEIKNLSYMSFLTLLKKYIPFTHLVLGENSHFGKDREGSAKNIKMVSSELGFEATYIPLLKKDDKFISSSTIRELLMNGNLGEAEELLGRPHFVFYPNIGKKRALFTPYFLTFSLPSNNFLLPDGKYSVEINSTPALLLLKKGAISLYFSTPLANTDSLLITFSNKFQPTKNIVCQTSPAEL